MSRLLKLLRLSAAERALLLEGALLLSGAILGLRVLRLWRVQRLLDRVGESRRPERFDADRIALAMNAISMAVPGSGCLARALAARALLRRWGHPATLRIGVARDGAGKLEAHAWVECSERVLIGGEESARYTPLHTARP